MLSKEDVINAIKLCYDPEIPVNVYDLGLIYDVDVKGDKVSIAMTLTTQHCPSAQQIPRQVKERVQQNCGTDQVEVNLIFDPPWTPERITETGKKILGLTPPEAAPEKK